MADITQTAANVKINNKGPTKVETAGEAVTQGMPVYLDSGKWYKAQATLAKHAATRIALTAAATDGEFVSAMPGCELDLGATLVVGETYAVSANAAGAIAPIGDLTTADVTNIIGIAETASSLPFRPYTAGVAKA